MQFVRDRELTSSRLLFLPVVMHVSLVGSSILESGNFATRCCSALYPPRVGLLQQQQKGVSDNCACERARSPSLGGWLTTSVPPLLANPGFAKPLNRSVAARRAAMRA